MTMMRARISVVHIALVQSFRDARDRWLPGSSDLPSYLQNHRTSGKERCLN
jgi:hypothetical protein